MVSRVYPLPPAPRARGLTTRLRHNRPFSLSPLGSNQKCNAASSNSLHSKTLMDCRHCIMLRATHGFLRLLQVVATAQRFIVLTFLNHCLALRLDCSAIQKRTPDEDAMKIYWNGRRNPERVSLANLSVRREQYLGSLQPPQAFNGTHASRKS